MHVARFLKGDDRTTYNVIYLDGVTGNSYIKRFNLTGVVRERIYDLTRGSDKSRVLYFSANSNGEAEKVQVSLKMLNKKQRRFTFERDFRDVPIKGKSAVGLLVTKGEINSVRLLSKGLSTLGGREVWFDPDVMRINYNGQGDLLGEFHAEDRILVVRQGGECYTTDISDSNYFPEDILRIEKHDRRKIWTAVYWDAEQGYPYIKRFPIEPDQKNEQITGDDKQNTLLLLTDTYYARIVYAKEQNPEDSALTELEVEPFATVKSIRAKGRRLCAFPIGHIAELEPLYPNPYAEEEEQGAEHEDEALVEEEQEGIGLFAHEDE